MNSLLALPAHMVFALLSGQLFQPTSSPAFTLLILSPILSEESEMHGPELPAGVKR